jgi:hypothetical protein
MQYVVVRKYTLKSGSMWSLSTQSAELSYGIAKQFMLSSLEPAIKRAFEIVRHSGSRLLKSPYQFHRNTWIEEHAAATSGNSDKKFNNGFSHWPEETMLATQRLFTASI